jgi:hypothetical protein
MEACTWSGRQPVFTVACSPLRANAGEGISQGKPWAKFSWPLRATDLSAEPTLPEPGR